MKRIVFEYRDEESHGKMEKTGMYCKKYRGMQENLRLI